MTTRDHPIRFIFKNTIVRVNDHSLPSWKWSEMVTMTEIRNFKGTIGFRAQNRVRNYLSQVHLVTFNFYVSHANRKIGSKTRICSNLLIQTYQYFINFSLFCLVFRVSRFGFLVWGYRQFILWPYRIIPGIISFVIVIFHRNSTF